MNLGSLGPGFVSIARGVLLFVAGPFLAWAIGKLFGGRGRLVATYGAVARALVPVALALPLAVLAVLLRRSGATTWRDVATLAVFVLFGVGFIFAVRVLARTQGTSAAASVLTVAGSLAVVIAIDQILPVVLFAWMLAVAFER